MVDMKLCNYNWNLMNLRMLDIIEFDITYERYGDERHLHISRGISEIGKAELRLIFKREKGTKVFKLSFEYVELRKGNEGHTSYNFQHYKYYDIHHKPVETKEIERLFLYWDPARG
jgi:hypothetical protein